MKKISLKNIKETLTRAEMKAINGGSGSGSSTTCYGSEKVCYTDEQGTKYRCSGPAQPESEADCCCGHDSGSGCVMG
jgi:hypothetical protein